MRITTVTVTIVVLLMLTASAPIHAQEKSPGAAALMSVALPGSGHFYTHQPQKGLLLTGTYLGSLGMVIAYGPWTWEEEKSKDDFFGDLDTGTSSTTKIIWYGSAALGGAVLIYSAIDAAKSAREYNEGKLSIGPYFRDGSIGAQLAFSLDL